MDKRLLLVFGLIFAWQSLPAGGDATLTQWSTIDALLKGQYDGVTTLGEVKKSGDFGLGTLDGLDGEMLLLDGKIYQVDSHGAVHEPANEVRTPLAVVTFFAQDLTFTVPAELTMEELQARIDAALPSPNRFYAVRVTGRFAQVKTRSVPRQTKPYLPLAEVVKTQALFTLTDTTGTLVGFRCPAFVKSLNVPGYHLHYLTDDKRGGGHVLGLVTGEGVRVAVEVIRNFMVKLPDSPAFDALDLSGDRSTELKKVESERK
jgi:acetolactate decarboxylase